ncbi:DUF222 domain-containing protein [Mycobacterium sp. 852002-51152_SCH6134967]|uniref:DUF222 domain-containing protein n=1 Tax=Mycobacterium sp. 852002-51152_SCH6134967 TaxID=1834096 RepID=UPI000A6A4A19|nr:DUF222 domain-containing protein [Mycobacterium sp. 852002-51152_SCH6134967]
MRDAAALTKIDAELATELPRWGILSATKLDTAIDTCVDRYDAGAVRRTENAALGRDVVIHDPPDGSGTAAIEGWLFAADTAALDARLDAMAAAVCDHDPRTTEQRRADALGALGHGADRLTCACGRPECEAATATPSAVVIHVIARHESLSDDTPAALHGAAPHTPHEENQGESAGPAGTDPGYLMGKGVLPGAAAGEHPGRHRQTSTGDPPRRCRARTALQRLNKLGVVRALPRPPVSRRQDRVDLPPRADLYHPPRQPPAIPRPVPAHRTRRHQHHHRHQHR